MTVGALALLEQVSSATQGREMDDVMLAQATDDQVEDVVNHVVKKAFENAWEWAEKHGGEKAIKKLKKKGKDYKEAFRHEMCVHAIMHGSHRLAASTCAARSPRTCVLHSPAATCGRGCTSC